MPRRTGEGGEEEKGGGRELELTSSPSLPSSPFYLPPPSHASSTPREVRILTHLLVT